MKDFIILNLGLNGSIMGDQLQEYLATENQVSELNLQNRESEFLVKSFYYETQNGQFVPKTIFVDSESAISKKKIYAKQNFSTLRLMADKCDNLQGIIVITSTHTSYSQYIAEQQKEFPTVPFYFFNLIEDQISILSQISMLQTYEMLHEFAELSIAINGQVFLDNKQVTAYPPRSVSQFISSCLASINQPYRKAFDLTMFPQFLFDTYDQKYLSCGFDNYINSYTNNWSGINYQEGKFNRSALIVRGDANAEQIKQVQEYTQIQPYVGILEKAHPGIAQISNHSGNVNILQQTLSKFEKVPKQFFSIEYEANENLQKIVAAYQQ